MNVLSVENLSKSYGERILLSKISFTIEDTNKIGLIGINGTGKSSLLNLLVGNDLPDSGEIGIPKNIKIEHLQQNPEFDPEATVLKQVFKGNSPVMQIIREYEKILEDISGNPKDINLQKKLLELTSEMNSLDAWTFENQVKTILNKLGITNFSAKMGTLSGGQRKRVALASALITPCDLLLLDEPTNHLDNWTIDWLERYLLERKGAVMMITHDRYFLDRVANKTFELDSGNLYVYSGNYSEFLEKKAERNLLEYSMEEKRQNLYRRELEWIRKGARARTTKQKARIQRFDELEKSKIPTDDSSIDISIAHSRLGKKILEISHLSKGFNGNTLIKDFNYILLRDDRIGIIGDNGKGKTTLLNLIIGNIFPDSGKIDIGDTVKIGYFSQQSEDMDTSIRAIEYIKKSAEFVTTADGTRISASQMMERFLFTDDMQWTYISRLSGGEKRCLYLLNILMKSPNLLLLDEPTNDLDIDTLRVLESYLDDFKGAVILVSHDRYFLDRTCNKIFSFEEQGEIIK
ncbi:MAG: ABC-F family ATP-binding cassette domain-containing protein, partial [Eubacteriales bacterium]